MPSTYQRSVTARALSLLVAAATAGAPLSAAAGPAKGKKAAAQPATDGRTVALLRFAGDPRGEELRSDIQDQLQQAGFTTKGVALDIEAAAAKVKCKGEPTSDECLAALGKWLNANPKTAADFIVFGEVAPEPPNATQIVTYDIAKAQRVDTIETAFREQDLILPIALPQEVATDLQNHIEPPPPATAEEQQIIAELDEPEKTPEELAEEKRAIEEAQAEAEQAQQDQVIDTGTIEVDLRDDFKDFCRTGKRKKRTKREDPKDLRPSCKLGPFWGYWQPRAWVALGLTAGAAIGTIAMYSAALAARGPYKDAVDDLDAYLDMVGGDPSRDPTLLQSGGQRYDALATKVSEEGATMRQRAIIGDALLGTTVLLGGVLAIIIYQDRRDAKAYIKQEKGLRAISDVRVGPIMTRETKGLGMSFRF